MHLHTTQACAAVPLTYNVAYHIFLIPDIQGTAPIHEPSRAPHFLLNSYRIIRLLLFRQEYRDDHDLESMETGSRPDTPRSFFGRRRSLGSGLVFSGMRGRKEKGSKGGGGARASWGILVMMTGKYVEKSGVVSAIDQGKRDFPEKKETL